MGAADGEAGPGVHVEGLRTPACQVFYQDNLFLDWRTFPDLVTLRRMFFLDASRFLLGHAERYGVTVTEAEALRGFHWPAGEGGEVPCPAERPPGGPLSKAQGAGGGA